MNEAHGLHLQSRQSLIEADRRHLVHPTTSWKEHEQTGPTILKSGKGAFVTDANGKELLDAFSGLWCVNVGYGQQSIVKAAAEQMTQLPYATGYFGYCSEPAIRLAEALATRAPGRLEHVFFTLGGSDAIDSAVRFIKYFFNITGRGSKKHFIALDRGYHGSSSEGSGLTGLNSFHVNFDVPTPIQHHIPTPYRYRSDEVSDRDLIARSVKDLRTLVQTIGAERIAAFVVEPVIGSGGVIVPPPGWLTAMRDTCTDLDILLLVDEVITAFGRTGPLFGCEYDNVEPDIITLAKGLTSGYAPMGAVLISDDIYRAIADNTREGAIIGHGLTYSGHPVSAAVALEVLRIYEDGLLAHGHAVGEYFDARLNDFVDHPLVGDVRSRGMLAGIELVTNKETKASPAAQLNLPHHLKNIGYANGLIFRAFPDATVGLAPPLCCTTDDIDLLLLRLERTLDEVLELKDVRRALGA